MTGANRYHSTMPGTNLMRRACMPAALLALACLSNACGGGGGGGEGQPPPVALNCPANKIQVGEACQCPAGLIENPSDGYCTDPAGTVLRGAEYLEPGFPVSAPVFGGSGYGPVYVKVGNVDDDPQLEIFYKRIGMDIWAWDSDGTVLDGYPVHASTFRHGKMALAELDGDGPQELFVAHEGTAQVGDACELNGFDELGNLLNGFPLACTLSIKYPPVVVDFNGDDASEILYIDEGSSRMNILENGVVRAFSPDYSQSQPTLNLRWCGLAAADINGDSQTDVLALSCPYTKAGTSVTFQSLYVYDAEGDELPGFPIEVTSFREHQPLIGDVDGDLLPEIITITQSGIAVISNDGIVQSEFDRTPPGAYPGAANFPFLGLADLTGDGTPEILYQQDGVHAVTPDGTELNGYPVDAYIYFAVGDVDGVPGQEVVSFREYPTQLIDDPRVVMQVFGSDGGLKDFDIVIDLVGVPGEVMPTIADVDRDGRNEIIVAANFWEGVSAVYPQLWVFDLGGQAHGEVDWGQQYGNEHNAGTYKGEID